MRMASDTRTKKRSPIEAESLSVSLAAAGISRRGRRVAFSLDSRLLVCSFEARTLVLRVSLNFAGTRLFRGQSVFQFDSNMFRACGTASRSGLEA